MTSCVLTFLFVSLQNLNIFLTFKRTLHNSTLFKTGHMTGATDCCQQDVEQGRVKSVQFRQYLEIQQAVVA